MTRTPPDTRSELIVSASMTELIRAVEWWARNARSRECYPVLAERLEAVAEVVRDKAKGASDET